MEVIVDIINETENYKDIKEENIEKYAETVLKEEFGGEKDVYVSLVLSDNESIRKINREYRDKDKATDVISFAYLEVEDEFETPYITLGDIIISLEKVDEQSKEYGHSFERELYYVLTHGILHLLGYDHIEEEDKIEMRKKEEEILSRYGYTREA